MNLRSRSIHLLLACATFGLCTSLTGYKPASAQAVEPQPSVATSLDRADTGSVELEAAVLAEINRMRTNPAAYAAWLEEVKAYYDGTTLAFPDEPRVRTVEGVAAVENAIAVLNRIDPLPPLAISAGLNSAAHDHVQDLIRIGALSLTGSDGSQPSDRIGRYGTLNGQAAELLNYGNQTAAGLVMQLVISDGNPNRTSRATLLRSDFTDMGIACDRNGQQMLCVLDYASEYIENEGLNADLDSGELGAEPAESVESADDVIETGNSTAEDATDNATAETVSNANRNDAVLQIAESDTPSEATFNPPVQSTEPANQVVNESRSDTAVVENTKMASDNPQPVISESEPFVPATNSSGLELSDVEQALIEETNRLREDPAAYAEKLEQLLPYYDELQFRLPDQPAIMTTVEGVSAVEEAIAVLRATEPLPQLEPMAGLTLGATDHALDLGTNNLEGHYGSDGSDPFERISRYGTYHDIAGENISYSTINTAEWHVIQWLIDDGVADRGHRETLLKPNYRMTGVACEPHAAYGNVCVMTYAGTYTNNEEIRAAAE